MLGEKTATFDCGNKKRFVGANISPGLREPKMILYIKDLIYLSLRFSIKINSISSYYMYFIILNCMVV